VSTTAPAIENMLERLSQDIDGTFDDLVTEYQHTVFTTALRLSVQAADAEDIAAETFLRAYAALRNYPRERILQLQLRPWLITIVLNLWRNQLRSASRRLAQVGFDAAVQPTATAAGPEEHSQRREDQRQLADLLSRLPDKQRVAVLLRHVAGLSIGEVAQVLGCPEGTAKSHVSRGLSRLRTLTTAVSQEGSS
jgi:RNA polymerase sigma factor (sigma-70 family)